MDKFGDYIGITLKGLHISRIRKFELEEEIRDHLEMLKCEFIKDGNSPEQAETKAIERFGECGDIRSKFKKVFTPYIRFKDSLSRKKILKECVQWTVTIVGALLISLTLRSYAFASTEVKQCSMQETLYEGQKLIESKIEYYYSEPRRGDIVVINEECRKGIFNTFIQNTKEFIEKFYKSDEEQNMRLIKRVIGIPGDQVNIKEGKVYINGQLYNESYVKGVTFPNNMVFPITIPENEYFVMGDNRENSTDSRDIGLIRIERIEGKAILRFWPLNKAGGLYEYRLEKNQ